MCGVAGPCFVGFISDCRAKWLYLEVGFPEVPWRWEAFLSRGVKRRNQHLREALQDSESRESGGRGGQDRLCGEEGPLKMGRWPMGSQGLGGASVA